ncbi:MAG: sialidase family protein [Phycisphaerae bacterium]
MTALHLFLIAVLWLAASVETAHAGENTPPSERPAKRAELPRGTAAGLALCFAESDDGRVFAPSEIVLARHAAAPDLIRLRNGRILAIFDAVARIQGSPQIVLAVSRSDDDGRTWSPPRAIRLEDRGDRIVRARHGELVRMPGGGIRLFFACDEKPKAIGDDAPSQSSGVLIRAATTRNGLDYRVDDVTRIELEDRRDVHPSVVWIDDRAHLFASRPPPEMRRHEEIDADDHPAASTAAVTIDRRVSATGRAKSALLHFVSNDGRRFIRERLRQGPDFAFLGNLFRRGATVRGLVMNDGGVRLASWTKGRPWRVSDDLVIEQASDPAIVRRAGGGYLMLYVAPLDERTRDWPLLSVHDAGPERRGDRSAAVEDSLRPVDTAAPDLLYAQADGIASDASDLLLPDAELDAATAEFWETLLEPVSADADDSQVAPADASDALSESSDAPAGARPAVRRYERRRARDETRSAAENLGYLTGETPVPPDFGGTGFPPMPDFRTRVSYAAWLAEQRGDELADNSYPYYDAFLPNPFADPAEAPFWPEFNDMFNSADHDAPPAAWTAAAHPDWADSNDAAQGVLQDFREAAAHETYAPPMLFGEDAYVDGADEDPLLLGMLLPQLSPHRTAVKALLADSWRADDEGRVSPERMVDAWRTALTGADHLHQGMTLIEKLVGVAEENLVRQNARWALAQGVFEDQQLEAALVTLMDHDREITNAGDWLRGEYAMAMDTMQHIFVPGDSADGPRVDLQLARQVFSYVAETDPAVDQALVELTPEDAQPTAAVFDAFYRETAELYRIGSPEARAADVDAVYERYGDTNVITRSLLPSVSRVAKLRTRGEASRRATQLAYAVHIYKDRTGQWPAALEDATAPYGETMRIDPFTGGDFGYAVTDDGPVIYSLSENGVDDGGVHAPRWDDGVTDESTSEDFVFWPPRHRPRR